MASYTQHSSRMELHESEIAKPKPLRIIKRSQTIAGSSSSREDVGIRNSLSALSDSSRGSPPLGADQPLTVHKRRKGRGSIIGSSVGEGPLEQNNGWIVRACLEP